MKFFENKSYYDKGQNKWQENYYINGELVDCNTYFYEMESESENVNKNENSCECCCEYEDNPINELINSYVEDFVDIGGCPECIEDLFEVVELIGDECG